jgi:3-oxoacyl-[acyl-carrier-protein] synthase II
MRFSANGIGWVTPSGLGSGQPGEILRLGSGQLPALKSSQFLETPHPRFGRFDSYAKAGFGAIALALRSARLDRWTQKRPFGLVVGTRLGCLEADLAYFHTAACDGGTLASPNLFAYTLSSTMLGEASIQFGLTGASFVVDDAAGHLAGVYAALDLMAWGLCETVVAGWCDVGANADGKRGHSTFPSRDHSEGEPPGEKVECPLFRSDAQELCGAVFFVLTKGAETAPWQWDGRELTAGTQRMADLASLTHRVLELQR